MRRFPPAVGRASLLLGLTAWLAAAPSDAAAEQGATAPIVQRIFVPADRPETWPLGDDQYVPTPRDQWEQLLRAAEQQAATRVPPPPEIIQANYVLRIFEPDRLSGEAVLQIRLPREQTTWLPLVPLSPRITQLTPGSSLRWPTLGSWVAGDDDAPRPGLLLEHSGEVRFQFTQRGIETGGSRRFALGLPNGIRQTIAVETPRDVDVQLDRAFLQSRTSLEAGRLRWNFRPSPGGRRELRVVTAQQSTGESVADVRYRQEESYRLAKHGLDYETTLIIRSADSRELELELQTSDELQLLQATVDGLPAAWTGASFSPASRLVLPPTGQPYTVRLRGAAKIVLSQPWELPTIRLRDAQWTEGAVQLSVDPRLELSAVRPLDAHLTGALGVGGTTSDAEVYRLQAWHVQSGVEIVASRPLHPMSVDILSVVVLDDVVENIETTLVFRGRRPNDFHAELPVAAGWRVESVDSTPTGEVLHWRVVDNQQRRTLQVQFRTAPTHDAPLVLKVSGRRAAKAIDLPAQADDFSWLDASAYRSRQRLLWLSGRQSDDRIVAASSLSTATTPAEEVAAEFRVARPGARTVALDLAATPGDATIDLERREPAYDAEAVVACAADEQQYVYQVELSCRPLQGAVRDLPVVFSRPLPASAQWSLGKQGATLAVTPLDAPTRERVDDDPQPSVYRVYLPEPASQRFRITVVYRRPRQAKHEIDGATLPDAQQFHSWAVLLGDPAETHVDGRSCPPAPLPDRDASTFGRLPEKLPVLAAYRYDEDYPLRLRLAPLLTARPQGADTLPGQGVLCHWAERSSLHALDGQIRCRGAYLVSPRGQESVRFHFPTEIEIEQVEAWIDQRPAVVTPSPTTPRQVDVLLPAGVDAMELTIDYVATSAPLDQQTYVTDPWPVASFSTPTGRWTVWTPPRYHVDVLQLGSASIVERLFGPLARRPSELPFRPWQRDDWQLPGRLAQELQIPYQHARQLLRRLDHRLLAAPDADRRALLRETLAAWLEATSILVDAAALSIDLEGDAGTEFPIALAISSEAIIVTTPRRMAHWWRDLKRTASERIFVLPDNTGPATRPANGLASVATWLKSAADQPSLDARRRPTPLAMEGWQATQFTVVGETSPPPLVVPARQRIVWKAYCLLAAVAGVWWSRGVAGVRVGLVILALATLCLVAPRPWLVVPQATWLGLGSGWLAGRLFQRIRTQRPAGALTSTLSATLLALTVAACPSLAAEPTLPRTQVLIPIDDRGETVGDQVYVPAEWLRRLQAKGAGEHPYDRQAAVLTGGRWRLFLPEGNESLPPERSSLTLQGQTFRPGMVLSLPLERGDAVWLDASHRLNGAPVELSWLDEQGCRVPLGNAGPFQLQVYFRPRVRQSDGRGAVSMAIPRLPASELLLDGVQQLDDVVVADAVETSRDDSLGQATALLSSTDRLLVSWRPRTPVSRRVRVEQLQWLTIDPAGSRSDALIRLTGAGLAPEEVTLQLSDELALAADNQQEAASPIVKVAAASNRIVLQIEPDTQLPLEIPLSLQLKRTVSIGRIPMPTIDVVGIERVRNWFAASIDSRLNYEESSGAALRRVAASEFADRWGSASRQPATAWAVDQASSDWSIRVWPRRSPTVAKQTLRLWRRPELAVIDYAVDVAAGGPEARVYRFETPPDLTLDAVTVTLAEAETPLATRYAVSEPGHVTVFLGEPLRAAHRVRLSGRQRLAADAAQPVPRFRLRDAELGPLRLVLDRDRRLDVRLAGPAVVPQDLPSETPSPEFARVGDYRLDDQALGGAVLHVAPNRVQAYAETALRVVPESQPVEVELWIALDVEQGIVDRLTLRAPRELSNLRVVAGSEATTVRTSVDQGSQRIQCFFSDPIAGGQQRLFKIRGQLASTADRRIRLPDIRLPLLEETARYVVLPSILDDRSLRWVWDNLHSQRLPPSLSAAATGRSASFRVTGEQFFAEQQIQPKALRPFSIRSAEVSGVVDAAGNVVATSRYLLQTGKVEQCNMRLPEGAELQSLTIGGRPAAIAPGSSAVQSIALSPPLMPIQIEARYRHQLEATGSRLTLTAPQLEIAGRAVPTAVRWEISAAEGLHIVGAAKARRIDPRSFVARRRRQQAESVQQASLLALQLPDWEAQQWYDGWRSEFTASDGPAVLLDDQSAEEGPDAPWALLARRFDSSTDRSASNRRKRLTPPSRDASYWATQSGTLALKIARTDGGWHRWMIASCVLLVVAAGQRYRRWFDRAAQYLAARSELIVVAGGLAWWYWLRPSLPGAAVALVAAVLYCQRRATRRRLGDDEVAAS